MTISTEPTPLSYAGDGSTTAFPVTWKYFSKSHVLATLRDSDGDETTWVLDTDYSLTAAGDDAGGTLTATVAPATGETLFISLDPPNTQTSSLPLGGPFPSTTVEDMSDLAAQRDGKLEALFNRALRVPKTDTQSDTELELPIDSERAGMFLSFDANGSPIAAAGTSANLGPVSSFVDTLLDDSSANVFVQTLVAGLTVETLPTTSDKVLLGDVSESAGNAITLDNLRTAIPMRGYIGGLTLSNNGSDATNDIDIAAGEATDTTGAVLMRLTSAITKRLDAAWAVGTNQGGLDTGAIANDVYHLWLIRRSDTGVVDVLFSASATSPTMPTNYDQKRRIGAIIRASAAILAFTQFGEYFALTTPILDINASNPGSSAVTRTLASVPDGVRVKARLNIFNTNSAAADDVYVSEIAATDQATSGTASPLSTLTSQNNLNNTALIEIMTSTSATIRSRHGIGTNTSFRITTLGWFDYRDRYN